MDFGRLLTILAHYICKYYAKELSDCRVYSQG